MRPPWWLCVLCVLATPAFGQTPSASQPATGVHFVYLVRHGIYDRDSTATDDRVSNGLNALGHEQARLAGARLAGLGVKFDRLISSEFLRAKQTADDIGAVLKMTPTRDGLLNECTPTTVSAFLMAREKPSDLAACDSARVRAWQRYFFPTPEHDTYDVLVAHGNVIRWMLMRALGADLKHWSDEDTANGSLTIITVRPDGSCRLAMYSDVGHIPVEKQTWTGRGGGWGKAAR